jgi:hypothetical protein
MPAFVGHFQNQPHKIFIAVAEDAQEACSLASDIEFAEPSSVRAFSDYGLLRFPIGADGQEVAFLESDERAMLLPGADFLDILLFPRNSGKDRNTRDLKAEASRPNLYVDPRDPGYLYLALGFDEEYMRRIIPGSRLVGDADDLLNIAFGLNWTGAGYDNGDGPYFHGDLVHLRRLVAKFGGPLEDVSEDVDEPVAAEVAVEASETEEPVAA